MRLGSEFGIWIPVAAIVAMTAKATKSPAFVSISGDFGSSQLFAQNIHRTWAVENRGRFR